MPRRYRFLHVGLGPLGVRIADDVVRRGLGDVVAAVDPALAGRPLNEIVVGAAAGVVVAAGLDEVSSPIDVAVVATVSDLPGCAPTLRALLARGVPIVSTCEELSWAWDRHPALAAELDALARAHGVPLLGTGVNPGFVMDALPVSVTTVCRELRAVAIHRIQDASLRRIPFQQKIGATLTVAEFGRRVSAGTVRHVGLYESAGMIARTLGLPFESYDESIAPVVADTAMTCGLGEIAVGDVRGVHQEARVTAGGRDVITLVFRAAIGEPSPRDRVIVDGDPRIDLTIDGGVHGDVATSAVALNTIVGLLDHGEGRGGSPGLHAMARVPLFGCAPPR